MKLIFGFVFIFIIVGILTLVKCDLSFNASLLRGLIGVIVGFAGYSIGCYIYDYVFKKFFE